MVPESVSVYAKPFRENSRLMSSTNFPQPFRPVEFQMVMTEVVMPTPPGRLRDVSRDENDEIEYRGRFRHVIRLGSPVMDAMAVFAIASSKVSDLSANGVRHGLPVCPVDCVSIRTV